jgi:hypothetical protein
MMQAIKPERTLVQRKDNPERPKHRVRLPGFLAEQEIGLGDVAKLATYAMGIKPCADCQRRAAALNRWMRFTR